MSEDITTLPDRLAASMTYDEQVHFGNAIASFSAQSKMLCAQGCPRDVLTLALAMNVAAQRGSALLGEGRPIRAKIDALLDEVAQEWRAIALAVPRPKGQPTS